MNKINLNDYVNNESESTTVVFNNGVAGRVKGVRVEIVKKTSEDKQNSPDYKVNFLDEAGGSVNIPVYYPTDRTTESETKIRMNQLVSILHSLNPALKKDKLPEFETLNLAYDYLVKQIAANVTGRLVNVFVNYGIEKKPSSYLAFRAFNIVEPLETLDESTRLVPQIGKGDFNDIMERMQPTNYNNTNTTNNGVEIDSPKEGEANWPE